MAATRFGGRGPSRSTSWASVGASTSSITMRAEPSSSTTSKMVTAPEWFRLAAAWVSRSSLARNSLPPFGRETDLFHGHVSVEQRVPRPAHNAVLAPAELVAQDVPTFDGLLRTRVRHDAS